MEWSEQTVIDFLQLYEKEPCIWNPSNSEHKIRNVVHDAWKRIECKLSAGFTVAELKTKKISLMAQYRKVLKRVTASTRTGSGTDTVYTPDWFAYKHMTFLQGNYTPNATQNSEELNESTEGDEDNRSDQDETTDNVEEIVDMEMPSTSAQTNQSAHQSPVRLPMRKRNSAVANIETHMKDAYKVLKRLSDAGTVVRDNCSIYTELLTLKLRALDESTKDIAMHEIDKLMFTLKQNKNHTQPLSHPPNNQTYNYPSHHLAAADPYFSSLSPSPSTFPSPPTSFPSPSISSPSASTLFPSPPTSFPSPPTSFPSPSTPSHYPSTSLHYPLTASHYESTSSHYESSSHYPSTASHYLSMPLPNALSEQPNHHSSPRAPPTESTGPITDSHSTYTELD